MARFGPKPSQPGGERLLGGPLAEGLDRYAAEVQALMDAEFEPRRAAFRWSRWQRPDG